jgi:1-acyl-sn-glycerol-3-phosphate acyltransferase
MTLAFSLRLEGRGHVPRTGPVLLLANHQSFLDPILVGVASPRHLYYLARKTLFRNPVFTWLIRSVNAVPIDQEGIGKEGLQTILGLLQAGRAVVVFPEGTRTTTGAMNPLKPGIHLLIKRARAPIVPVGIAGAYDAWPLWRPVPIPSPLFLPASRRTLAVAVGQPLDSRRFADLPREQLLGELFLEIQKVQARAERLRRKW